MSNKNLTIGLVIVAVIAIIGAFVGGHSKTTTVGSVTSSVSQGSLANYLPHLGLSQLQMGTSCDQSYSCTAANSIGTFVTAGTITAGSPLVVIANPFSATSTITLATVSGTAGTTTVNILVGTTTATTASSTSNNFLNSQVSASLFNITISTTTQFYSTAGVLAGPGWGYTSPGSGSYAEIVVGPLESIAIVATNTAQSFIGGNAGILFPTSTTTIIYKFKWQR